NCGWPANSKRGCKRYAAARSELGVVGVARGLERHPFALVPMQPDRQLVAVELPGPLEDLHVVVPSVRRIVVVELDLELVAAPAHRELALEGRRAKLEPQRGLVVAVEARELVAVRSRRWARRSADFGRVG